MRYAALKALILIVLGIIFSQYIKLPNLYLLIYFVLAIILAVFTKGYSLYLALFLASALNFNGHKARQITIENFPLYDSIIKVQAQIIETPISNDTLRQIDTSRYTVKLLKVNGSPLSGKVLLYVTGVRPPKKIQITQGSHPQEINLSYGDVIEFNSKIIAFDFPKNPNLIDYNNYYHKQGFIGNSFTSDSEIKIIKTGQGNWFAQHLIIPIRQYFFKTIDYYLDNEEKSLLIGMLLGEKRGMPKSLRDTFVDSGVAHILAVSGLHVGILIGVLLLLLPIFRIRGLPQLIIIVIITILYLGLIEFRTSAVRAGLMILFASLGFFLERRYESINGVLVAAIIIHLISPQALTDVSFQLSFFAVTAILLIAPRIYSFFKERKIHAVIKKYLILPFAVSFSATIGTGLIMLYHFFRFPILVVFANLLIIPLVGLALPLGFLVLLLNLFFKALAGIYANTLQAVLKLIILISEKFANLSFAIIEPGRPSVLLILIFYLAVMLILFWKNLRFRKISLALILLGLNFIVWQNAFHPNNLSITFLDVKTGDAIFLNLPNGRNMMIDAGEENEVVPQFLKSKGIKNIDLAVITHPHLDHYGGVRRLVDDFNIENLLIATEKSKDTLKALYTNLIDNIKRKGVKIYYADRGQIIKGLGINVEVLSPNAMIRRIYNMDTLNINVISIVMKVEYNNISFLFPGDLDDSEFIEGLPVRAKILKSPHHASKKANSRLLFNMVKPEYIVITGKKKVNQDVLNLIEQERIKLFNIRKDGALVIVINKNHIKFQGY